MIYWQNENYNENIDNTIKCEAFSKEKPQFSKELYTVIDKRGHKYIMEDGSKKIVNRKFKPYELQKVNAQKIQNKNPINIDKEIKANQKEVKVKQTLKQLDIEPSNIIEEKRVRKVNPKYI